MTSRFTYADALRAASSLNLKKQGVDHVGPCPRCGGRDRFAIRAGSKTAEVVLFCRKGCSFTALAVALGLNDYQCRLGPKPPRPRPPERTPEPEPSVFIQRVNARTWLHPMYPPVKPAAEAWANRKLGGTGRLYGASIQARLERDGRAVLVAPVITLDAWERAKVRQPWPAVQVLYLDRSGNPTEAALYPGGERLAKRTFGEMGNGMFASWRGPYDFKGQAHVVEGVADALVLANVLGEPAFAALGLARFKRLIATVGAHFKRLTVWPDADVPDDARATIVRAAANTAARTRVAKLPAGDPCSHFRAMADYSINLTA